MRRRAKSKADMKTEPKHTRPDCLVNEIVFGWVVTLALFVLAIVLAVLVHKIKH